MYPIFITGGYKIPLSGGMLNPSPHCHTYMACCNGSNFYRHL